MEIDKKLDSLVYNLRECTQYYQSTLPLCAAENVISDFCKIPLSGDFQERYIMGNAYSFDLKSNFVGSQYLLPFYSMIHEECKVLFGADYSDARTLTGMNCLTTVLMSITDPHDRIAILPAAWGGHPSVQPVCERLGLEVFQLPYDHINWDIDYDVANKMIKSKNIKYLLLAPSDIIHVLHVECFDLSNCTLLYDISQIMGLMAGKTINCPINLDNTILFGGTHKTLPGPASGLILTNSTQLRQRLENNINPKYLRHTQMHQVISLLFALLEMEYYGNEYAKAIVETANQLGSAISLQGFDIAMVGNKFSETHQLFIRCNRDEMDWLFENAIRYGITLNKKEKALFSGTGIRLGTQEIARYGWGHNTCSVISRILKELLADNPNEHYIHSLKAQLPEKIIKYTFPESVQQYFLASLH